MNCKEYAYGVIVITCMLLVISAPAERYVSTNSPNPLSPYTNWNTAAHNIQEAVTVATPGETVWVSNGVYNVGNYTNYPSGVHIGTRVAIDKSIVLRSVNGPGNTVIEGIPVTNEFAIRCVYIVNGAALSGFTLRNGGADTTGLEADRYGAGAYAETGAIISNCIFDTCFAERGAGAYGGEIYDSTFINNEGDFGAGAYAAVLTRCLLKDNRATGSGGGACVAAVTNCIITGNSANIGGGVWQCDIYNCLLVANSATGDGGGVYLGNVYNTTIFSNTCGNALNGAGAYGANLYNSIIVENYNGNGSLANYDVSDVSPQIFYSCTKPLPLLGAQNISGVPRFVNPAATNFYLLPLSPCIDAGENANWMTNTTDLNGQPRIYGGTVDMGALEWQGQVNQSTIRVTGELDFGYVTTGMTARSSMQINNDGPDPMQILRIRYPQGFSGAWAGTLTSGAMTNIIVEFSPTQLIAYGSNETIIVESYATHGDDTIDCLGNGTALQIPTEWLAQYNLPTNRTDKNVYVDFEDTDGDTFTTWQEWRAETNPTNALSYFRFTVAESLGTPGVSMTWVSATNRYYSLYRTTNLMSRRPYTSVFLHRSGETNQMEYTDPDYTAAQRYFYRIEIDE